MRNIFESIAITLVGLLGLLIIGLIVQYNMIEDDTLENISLPTIEKVSKKDKTNSYLQNLEGYSDVEVEVNPTQEDETNRIIVKSEVHNDSMGKALEDSYVKNLENYNDDVKQKEKPEELKDVSEPEMPKSEREDKVGSALDNLLSDM